MSARFTIVRGGDLAAAKRLLGKVAAAPRPPPGAAHLPKLFEVQDRSVKKLAVAFADRLAPLADQMEVRAFLGSQGSTAASLPSGPLRPADAERALSLGATLVYQKVDAQTPGFARLARSFELAAGQPAQVNLYAGPGGTSGLDWHRDPHDVLVAQLSGAKEFLVATEIRSGRGVSPRAIMLRPGDVLWLPRGLPHAARNGPSGSLHASIGLLHLTRAGGRLVRARDPDVPSASPGSFEAIGQELLGETLDALFAWRKMPDPGIRPGRARLRPDLLAALLEDDDGRFTVVTCRGSAALPAGAVRDFVAGRTPDDPEALMALDRVGGLGHEPSAVDTLALLARAVSEVADER